MRALDPTIVAAISLAGLLALPAAAQDPDCVVIEDFSAGPVGQFPAAVGPAAQLF